jgi:hypothetical protein
MNKEHHGVATGPRLLGGWLSRGPACRPMRRARVESVTSSLQGGVEVVRIDFSQPLTAVPAGFAIQSPARIALDIPGATNGMGVRRRTEPGQPAFGQRGAPPVTARAWC